MPKIIHNLRETIIAEARKQTLESSYSEMTMRSVADGCNIAVGTLYNYFKSKPEIVAAFMTHDWIPTIERINSIASSGLSPRDTIDGIAKEVLDFTELFSPIINDRSAAEACASVFGQWHIVIRDQLASAMLELCEKHSKIKNAYLPFFIADNILSTIIYHTDFDKSLSVIEALFE